LSGTGVVEAVTGKGTRLNMQTIAIRRIALI
jgi:hypothetical protein